jgi:hypothetical protein
VAAVAAISSTVAMVSSTASSSGTGTGMATLGADRTSTFTAEAWVCISEGGTPISAAVSTRTGRRVIAWAAFLPRRYSWYLTQPITEPVIMRAINAVVMKARGMISLM